MDARVNDSDNGVHSSGVSLRGFIDDSALLRRSIADPVLFLELYDRHAPDIYRYVARRLGEELVDEVMVRVFLRAFRRRRSFCSNSAGNVRQWLYGIVSGVLARYRREEVRRYRMPAAADAPSGTPAGHEGGQAALLRRVTAVLAGLSRKQREALLLVAWAGLSPHEAAQALHIPVARLQSRIDYACRSVAAVAAQPQEPS